MKTLRLLAPATLVLLASSCASSGGTSAGQNPSQPDAASEKDGDEEATKDLQSKLDKAEIKLQIARIEARVAEGSAARAVDSATLEAEMANQDLENFKSVARPLEEASNQLSLDRSRQRVKESQQELEELEKMYSKEEFADLTKELVLERSRAQLELAKRDLELTEKRTAQTRDFDWPRKERQLVDKVASTQRSLDDAKAKAEKGALERKLSMIEAEEAVQKAREALEKAAKKDA